VSVFRPKRKVTAPDGCEWEIYVSRVPLPAWRPARYSTFDLTGMPVDYLFLLLEIPRFLFNQILLPLARFAVDLPAAALRGRRTRTVTIEAICFWPRRESLVWTAGREHENRVVDQIVAALERAEAAEPVGATFRGRAA
jgi:hypothetical protein